MTLKPYVDNYLERIRIEKKSVSTQVSYRDKLYEFAEIMDEIKGVGFDLKDLSYKDLQQYITVLSASKDDKKVKNGRENKSSSVENKFITVKTFCKYLYSDFIIDKDITIVPRGGKFILPLKEKRTPKALSINEYQEMLEKTKWVKGGNNVYDGAYITLRNQAILSTLLTSGLRRAEILGLKWHNIQDGYIVLIGKGDKERYVPIHPIANQILNDWKRQLEKRVYKKHNKILDKNDLVFPSNRGTEISHGTFWEVINKALSCIGRNRWEVDEDNNEILDENGEKVLNKNYVRPHSLRKTAATSMHKQKVPIETIAEILGHEDIETTRIYVKVDMDDMQEAIHSIPMKGDFYDGISKRRAKIK